MLDDLERRATDAILAGFEDAEPPTAEEMRNTHCPECEEISARFAGKPWRAITEEDLARNAAVALLPAAALGYYLPGIMLRCVEARRVDYFLQSIVHYLSPPNGKPSEHLRRATAAFRRPQITALIAFLELAGAREAADLHPPEALEWAPLSKVVRRALAYWRGRAEQGARGSEGG
jgi:hypothetical protein